MELDIKKIGEDLSKAMEGVVKDFTDEMVKDVTEEVVKQIMKTASKSFDSYKLSIIEELSNEISITDSLGVKIRNRIYLYLLNNTEFLEEMNESILRNLEQSIRKSIR